MSESGKRKVILSREDKNSKYKHTSLEMETSTHMPMLIKTVQATTGSIAELGTGMFSTPLLHWLCFDTKRPLISYESYPHYLDFAQKFTTPWHQVKFVEDWATEVFDQDYSVVFIDHSINKHHHTRGDDALRFKDTADYIVLHDAGAESHSKYGYAAIYPEFKYRHDWVGYKVNTTVLSNRKDTAWLADKAN